MLRGAGMGAEYGGSDTAAETLAAIGALDKSQQTPLELPVMSTVDLSAYDTDKSQTYLANYEREFGQLFDEPIRLLELGIQRGGSMLLWLDLLPRAQIAGLDLNEVRLPPNPRLHIYQGFQQDAAILDRIATEVAPDGFDVIIDDASHIGKYTAESFWQLFPRHLKPGGVYVIDDWGCAYWPEWHDGHAYGGPRSAIGDLRGATPIPDGPGLLEQIRRQVRTSARPIAAKMSPNTRRHFQNLYMRAEGATLKRRFKSHDYGMAGFVKQLVDAVAVESIDRGRLSPFNNQIERVHIAGGQVFVHKRV